MGEAAAPAKAAARGIIARIIDALLASIGVLFNSAIIMLCIIDANSGINFVEEALYDATPKGPAAKVLMVLLLPITISLYTLVGLALALGFLIVNGWPVMIIHVACAHFFFAQWYTAMIFFGWLGAIFFGWLAFGSRPSGAR